MELQQQSIPKAFTLLNKYNGNGLDKSCSKA